MNEHEDISEKFSRLCDFFWRLDWPETPDDGIRHTSDVCRERASSVFEILGLADQLQEAADAHFATLPKEALERMASYVFENKKRRNTEQQKIGEFAKKRRERRG